MGKGTRTRGDIPWDPYGDTIVDVMCLKIERKIGVECTYGGGVQLNEQASYGIHEPNSVL